MALQPPRDALATAGSKQGQQTEDDENGKNQPRDARIAPPASVPSADPKAMPIETAALAIPRPSGGTCSAMTFELAGKAKLSHTDMKTKHDERDEAADEAAHQRRRGP